MLKVYCYSKCSTCKKALKWLDDNGVMHEVIDIKAENPDEAVTGEEADWSSAPDDSAGYGDWSEGADYGDWGGGYESYDEDFAA